MGTCTHRVEYRKRYVGNGTWRVQKFIVHDANCEMFNAYSVQSRIAIDED